MATPSDVASRTAVRKLADQAFARAASAFLVGGNSMRLLRDARENYPAWLDAIASARRSIHFESYIIHDDDVGDQFPMRSSPGHATPFVCVSFMTGWEDSARRHVGFGAAYAPVGSRYAATIRRASRVRLAGSAEIIERC